MVIVQYKIPVKLLICEMLLCSDFTSSVTVQFIARVVHSISIFCCVFILFFKLICVKFVFNYSSVFVNNILVSETLKTKLSYFTVFILPFLFLTGFPKKIHVYIEHVLTVFRWTIYIILYNLDFLENNNFV